MQPSDVCRICGGKGLLLQISDQGTDYTEDIEDCLAVKVKDDDGQSQKICHHCLGTLCLCKPYVTKLSLLKDNTVPSPKKCYTCQSTKGHLFPFPDTSVDKLNEYFGLNVVKTKNSKICHECQYYLDCVSDLREKANTAIKSTRHGQDKSMVKQKNATVDDLVSSLKDREVELDELPQSRKTSRSVKSSQVKSRGSSNNSIEEGLTPKRRSGAKNASATAEDDESDVGVTPRKKSNRQSIKENNLSDNDSPAKSSKESGPKRRRQLSRSSDSDLNSSVESVPDSKYKNLSGSVSELRRSSRDSNDSKQNESSKKSTKSKDSKEKPVHKPSPKSKRAKLRKHEEQPEAQSDSDNDSMCLASLADSDEKEKQPDETLKKSGRNRSSVKTPDVKVIDLTTSKKSLGRPRKNAEAEKQKQPHRNSKNESEGSKLPKRVHFEPELTKGNKRRKKAVQSRKKTDEESSDDEVMKAGRKKNAPLNAYTCTVCCDDFSSTVEGKEHELKHDDRFNNFEIKLVRVLKSEVAGDTKKSSKDAEDEEDDLWTMGSAPKEKIDKGGAGDAFDALFDAQAAALSSTTKGSEAQDLADKSGDTTFYNNSDSESDDPDNSTSKSGKPNDSSETVKDEDSKPSEVEKSEEVVDSKLSEDDKCTEKEESSEVEEKNETSGEEKLESEKEEEKSECEKNEKKSDADDTGSLNCTVAEPTNGGLDEEEKGEDGDDSKEEDKKPDDAEETAEPEEKKTELNGTDDSVEDIDSQDKEEVATVDESSPVKKTGCVESAQPDVDPDSSKETISEETGKAE